MNATRRNLRQELQYSHMLLILLMVCVIGSGVAVVTNLGTSLDRVLRNNYDSVDYSDTMTDALDAQHEAAMLKLEGYADRARDQYQKNWLIFLRAYQNETVNVTEPGEKATVDGINTYASAYRRDMQAFIDSDAPADEQARRLVFDELEPQVARLKDRVAQIHDVNEKALRRIDSETRAQSQQAAVAGIVALVLSIGASILVTRRTIQRSLIPLNLLARQAEEIGSGHWNHRIELRRTDEIGVLAEAFNRMAAQLKDAWSAEEQRRYVVERMANMALDSMHDAVLVVDAHGMVVHANRVAADMFSPVQDPGVLSIGHLVNNPQVSDPVERIVNDQTQPQSHEISEFVKLGTERVFRLRTRAMLDEGRLLGAVAVLEDVTHLRELDRLKTEFIGVASHELKTPVTSLLLSVQLLEEGAAGPLNPDQRAIVTAQRGDLQRLERTTRDLLDITRLESGETPVALREVRPAELVATAFESIRALAVQSKVNLESDVPPDIGAVEADAHQMSRVLINLLTNAIHHSPAGTVRVIVRPGPEEVAFAVEDTGAGIPPEYLGRIFERFVQVPGATGGGAGLGLSIAQAIVTAHHSRIEVDSVPAHGSTFRFALRVWKAPGGVGVEAPALPKVRNGAADG